MTKTSAEIETCAADARAKYAAGTLSPRLIAKLEAIPGWDWFEGIAPDARVAPEAFMAHCRTEYEAGTLPDWKVKRLEAIPGWTWDAVATSA